MTMPIIVPGSTGVSTPALSTVLQVDLARRATLDAGVGASGSWATVFGMRSIKLAQETGKTDNSDADTGLGTSMAVVSLGRTVEVEVERKVYSSAYDAGQEELRLLAAAVPPQLCHWRTFDRYGRSDENEEGFAIVEWAPQGGGQQDTKKVQIVLTNQGLPTKITNPVSVAVVPTAISVTKADGTAATSVATGAQVIIRGSGFLSAKAFGAAGVKFGSTNATEFSAPTDNLIIATVPATSAGSQPVTVVNAVGASTPALAFTHV